MNTPDESPESDDALPGIALPIPVPFHAAAAFGYRGDARFVGFCWVPGGDEVEYDDGRSWGTGNSYVFLAFRRHPNVARALEQFNIGFSDTEPDYSLILDGKYLRASVAPRPLARAFLRGQHPPPPELTPYEIVEAERQFDEMRSRRWYEVHVDPDAIRQAMEQERRTIARMLAFLDQWQAD